MCSDTYHQFFTNFLGYLTELLNDSDEEEDTFVQVTEENVSQHFMKSYTYQDLMKAPLLHIVWTKMQEWICGKYVHLNQQAPKEKVAIYLHNSLLQIEVF